MRTYTTHHTRWFSTPRTAGEAFRDAEYASAVEVYTPTVRLRQLFTDAVIAIVTVAALVVILWQVYRGAAA